MPAYNKNRSKIACTVCRMRKTRCDGLRPKCTFCQENGCVCEYVAPHGPSMEGNVQDILSRVIMIQEHLGIFNDTSENTTEVDFRSKSRPDYSNPSGFPYCTIKDIKFTSLVFSANFNLSTLARSLEMRTVVSNKIEQGSIAIVRHGLQELIQLYFRHTHRWYPILSKKDIFEDKLPIMQRTVLTECPESCLMLMILAIGALHTDDPIGLLQANEFHTRALSMLSCILEEVSLKSIQCLILISIFYGLRIMPMKAQEYVTLSSIKMQNFIEIERINKPENFKDDNFYLGEYETRAFWTLVILESEYGGTLHFADTDLSTYATNMKFPSLAEEPYKLSGSQENSPAITDEPDPHFLSEIGIRKIIDRTRYSFNNHQPYIQNSTSFASIVAKELYSQLDEWYSCLPASIKFKKSENQLSDAEHSSKAFIRGQYYATVILVYWPCLVDIIVSGDCRDQEHQEAFKIAIDAYVQFMLSATAIRMVELPLIWTHAASIFTNTAAIIRMVQRCPIQYDKIEDFKMAVRRAFEFLESVSKSSSSISYFNMILQKLFNGSPNGEELTVKQYRP